MKKRLFAMFLALTMALSLMPAALAAEEPVDETQNSVEEPQNQGPETPSEGNTTYVAEVNGQRYETLQKAIDAAEEAAKTSSEIVEIKLLESIETADAVTFDQSGKYLLNLNNCTYTCTHQSDVIMVKAGDLDLQIVNGTIKGTGTETYGLYVYNNKSTGKGYDRVNVTLDGVTMDVTDQTLGVQGLNSDNNLTVKNSTITSQTTAIYFPPLSGKLTIENSEITGVNNAIVIKGGTVEISGDKTTIHATGKPSADEKPPYEGDPNNPESFPQTGTAIYVEGGYKSQVDSGERPISLEIKGGTFSGDHSAAVLVSNIKDESAQKVQVSGGTFSSDVSAYLADGYVQNANGEVRKLDEVAVAEITTADGTTNKYETLQKAITAAQNGDTVKLLKTVTNVQTLTLDSGNTIDLNLNGFDLKFATDNLFKVTHGVLNFTGQGMVESSHGNDPKVNVPVLYAYGGETDEADHSVITIGKDVTVQNLTGYGIGIGHTNYKAYGAKVVIAGRVKAKYGFSVTGNAKATTGSNLPEIVVKQTGSIYSSDGGAIYAAGYAKYHVAGSLEGKSFGIEIRAGELTVEDTATITASGAFSNPVPNGNGFTVTGAAIAVSQHTTNLPIKVEIKGGNISETGTNGYALYEIDTVPNESSEDVAKDVSISVTGGTFSGGVYSTNKKLSISGGYFTSDPSAYCADGLTGIASGRADYPFTIGPKSVNKAEVAVAEPEVNNQLPDNASKDEKELAEKTKAALNQAADSAAITGPAMDAAAVQQANQNQVTQDEAKSALNDANIPVPEGTAVKVVIQTYMDIKITDASVEKNGDVVTKRTLTLDITPMYKTVATTAADLGQIETSGDQKNAVEITTAGTSGVLKNITGPVQVSIPLPAEFVADTNAKVYVQHKGYEYAAMVSQVGKGGSQTFVATFTNPHGFSKFTLSTTSAAVAKVNGNSYTSFQDAVNAAGSNDTIDVLQAGSYTASAGKTVRVKNAAGGEGITVTINGETKTVSKGKTVTFTYVPPVTPPQPDDRPSGGSDSSSSSDGDYIVSVDTGKHGTVTVSPKRADKGDTVTITVKPDKGYELDELVVTDKNGDTVKFKDKGNGKFSFTMPGSKVTVEAKFVKESASQLPFADVSADYWAYDEIAWAYENGYMNGTSATAFNPGGNVSRQQLWMILARLSGASPASMAEAREWAIGNGISDGSNPGGAISRQQMVATLYRYAKLMGYDTTGAADLTAFPDHASVADYAKEAMAWSVKNEIVGGTAQGTLNPAGTASRAQFAVILYRFVK